ncbi:hypothetical protein [Modestobacter sp. SYSU DS0290]
MRAVLLLVLGTVLVGCGSPGRACTEVGALTGVGVDTAALDLPVGTTAHVCLDDECTDVELGADPVDRADVWWGRPVPDVETVRVSLSLRDPAGTELWSAGAPVDTGIALPNGPGCGEWTVLPGLTATPDGHLTG